MQVMIFLSDFLAFLDADKCVLKTFAILALPRFVLGCYGDSVDNTVEENSSIYSLIRMCWLLPARACRQ